jgi:hypothetical protein
VARESSSSTSPYTGVNAIAPKPIALTVNSSPSVTVSVINRSFLPFGVNSLVNPLGRESVPSLSAERILGGDSM